MNTSMYLALACVGGFIVILAEILHLIRCLISIKHQLTVRTQKIIVFCLDLLLIAGGWMGGYFSLRIVGVSTGASLGYCLFVVTVLLGIPMIIKNQEGLSRLKEENKIIPKQGILEFYPSGYYYHSTSGTTMCIQLAWGLEVVFEDEVFADEFLTAMMERLCQYGYCDYDGEQHKRLQWLITTMSKEVQKWEPRVPPHHSSWLLHPYGNFTQGDHGRRFLHFHLSPTQKFFDVDFYYPRHDKKKFLGIFQQVIIVLYNKGLITFDESEVLMRKVEVGENPCLTLEERGPR